MLVLDNSGSIQDEDKLVHAKEGLSAFFRQVAPQDEVGLTKFSSKVTPGRSSVHGMHLRAHPLSPRDAARSADERACER